MAHSQSSTGIADVERASRTDRLELDDLFDVLGSHWRRRTIRHLVERPTVDTVDAFVTDLLSEHATTTTDDSATRIAFHHTHLPKLADFDIVEYDRETGTVAPGTNLEEAAACLFAVRESPSLDEF